MTTVERVRVGALAVLLVPVLLLHPVAVGGLGAQQPGAPFREASGIAAEYLDTVTEARELILDYMAERGVPGVSVAVGVDGRIIWSEGFGYANVEYRHPGSPPSRSSGWGSTSKPMTQVAASLLQEDGRL